MCKVTDVRLSLSGPRFLPNGWIIGAPPSVCPSVLPLPRCSKRESRAVTRAGARGAALAGGWPAGCRRLAEVDKQVCRGWRHWWTVPWHGSPLVWESPGMGYSLKGCSSTAGWYSLAGMPGLVCGAGMRGWHAGAGMPGLETLVDSPPAWRPLAWCKVPDSCQTAGIGASPLHGLIILRGLKIGDFPV